MNDFSIDIGAMVASECQGIKQLEGSSEIR